MDAGTLIRVGSAGLFVLLGIIVIAVGRRTATTILGALLIVPSALQIVNNLDRDATGALQLAKIALFVPAAALAIATTMLLPRPATARDRPALLVGAALGVGLVALLFGVGADALDAIYGLGGLSGGMLVFGRVSAGAAVASVGVMAGVLSWRAAAHPPESRQGWLRMAALVASLSAANIFQVAALNRHPFSIWTAAAVLFVVCGLTIPWLLAMRRGAGRIGLAMALLWPTLLAVFYVYQLVPGADLASFFDPWGVIGIIRVLGWTLLVYAIAKWDLLGVELPHFAVHRGVVAAGSLALLFIVAQVAQNFFSAQFGLYMGGIVAGTFVFAASPIQRAFERMGRREPPAPAAAPTADVDIDEAYKAAVRAAMRDGILTRREERHLAEVARSLRIDAVQALDLRDEVEREGVR